MSAKLQYARDCVAFNRACAAQIKLPKRCRFVAVMSGRSPVVMPITDPGVYEIDISAIVSDAIYPVLVLVIPAKHTTAFENMTTSMVADMIAQARVAVRGTRLQ